MAKKKKGTKQTASDESATGRRRIDDTPYDAAEPERIRDLERPPLSPPRDEDEFVTDAELEAREIDLPSEED